MNTPDTTMWDKARVQGLLQANDKAVCRAVALVYSNQTKAEQALGGTVEANGVGFTGADGVFLSSLAEFYTKTGFLSTKQVIAARRLVPKYWKQILLNMRDRGYTVSLN